MAWPIRENVEFALRHRRSTATGSNQFLVSAQKQVDYLEQQMAECEATRDYWQNVPMEFVWPPVE